MRADGSDKTQLTTSPLRDTLPAWSPDGRWIAFTRKRARSTAEDLWLIRPDGTGEHRLVAGASAAAWSPDGKRLVFSRYSDVWLSTDPSWSPDGKQILFDSTRDGNREVYLMNRDGSGQRNISHDPAEDWADTWRPQG